MATFAAAPTRRSPRPSWRLVIALAAVLFLAGCQAELLHQVPEVEANHIITRLDRHGIAASKELADEETNTWTIVVGRSSMVRAHSILDEYKLPNRRDPRVQDLFASDSLVRTPTQEGVLMKAALEGELAYTLEAIDGVIDARVHLVLPKSDLTGATVGVAKASVYIEYQSAAPGVLPIQDSEIKKMVAHAVDDLLGENVAVVQKPAAVAPPTRTAEGGLNLVSLGPLMVADSTLPTLRLLALGTAGVIVFLGLLLLWLSRRMSRLRGDLRRAQQMAAAPARGRGEGGAPA